VAIPAEKKTHAKGNRKGVTYNSLCMKIQRMWNTKCTRIIIPVIIGITGIETES
jgi:hypothetical protein